MKVCKIHGYLKEVQVKAGIYKGKTYRKCRQCENDRAKKYAERNRAKIRAKDKEYWEKNKTEISQRRREPDKLAKRREWDKANRDKYADYYREKQANYKSELADPYIKKVIQNGNKNIVMREIPNAMIDLQRTIIFVKRKLLEKRILKSMGVLNENQKC